MTDLLTKVKAALKGATPGPWVAVGEEYDDVRIETLHPMPKALHAYGDQTVVGSSEWTFLDNTDALLIALAPDMARALIAAGDLADACEDRNVFSGLPPEARLALVAFRAAMEGRADDRP
jgi:hypothetical protein